MHVRIHSDQILREYQRHEDWANIAEKNIASILRNAREKLHINLEEYEYPVVPVHERFAKW